jgi:hypothetical protein
MDAGKKVETLETENIELRAERKAYKVLYHEEVDVNKILRTKLEEYEPVEYDNTALEKIAMIINETDRNSESYQRKLRELTQRKLDLCRRKRANI